ncbi:hypothetical protein GKQ38_04720 [Candidatus Nanohaloarchaea archaeon]|nr:hypothetical protein GKQ38_04720 [Candidatus Nanohaloarchaea archaeon]
MVLIEQYIPHVAVAVAAFLLYRKDRQAFLVGGILTAVTCSSAYFLAAPELMKYTLTIVGASSMFSGYAASHFRAERLVLDALIEKVQSE